MGKDPTPPVVEVFSIVKGEDTWYSTMLNPPTLVGFAMAVNKTIPVVVKPGSKPNKDGLWCSYCEKPRHTKENCFKLHGKEQAPSRLEVLKEFPMVGLISLIKTTFSQSKLPYRELISRKSLNG